TGNPQEGTTSQARCSGVDVGSAVAAGNGRVGGTVGPNDYSGGSKRPRLVPLMKRRQGMAGNYIVLSRLSHDPALMHEGRAALLAGRRLPQPRRLVIAPGSLGLGRLRWLLLRLLDGLPDFGPVKGPFLWTNDAKANYVAEDFHHLNVGKVIGVR